MRDPVFDIFREEAREHITALEQGFLDLEAAASVEARRPLIDHVFRHVHSLKGDARAMGLDVLQVAAQSSENLLDALRDHPESVDQSTIDQSLKQLDQIRTAFEAWQTSEWGNLELSVTNDAAESERAAPVTFEPLFAPPILAPQLDLPGRQVPPAHSTPVAVPVLAAPTSDESFTVRVPSAHLDRMLNLASEIRVSQRSMDSIGRRLADVQKHVAQMPIADLRGSEPAPQELAEITATLEDWQSQMAEQLRRVDSNLRKKHAREALYVESLELSVRQARLLPLTMLADSLRRPIRDLAQSLGKEIRYEADVGKIMLDKAVIEALKDPLLHLVRNAADHGLETPSDRRAAGKSAHGTIRIHAARRGELVQLTISDDGRGIDYGRIRERIRQSGEATEAEIGELTQAELQQRLFQPGFSTVSAGEVSGRGVGLDVVQDTVRSLRGAVELVEQGREACRGNPTRRSAALQESAAQKHGTAFVIMVPVTISTIRIVTVFTSGQYYALPSSTVVRIGHAKREQLRELEGSLVLPLDGQPVRWVHLADLLGQQRSLLPTNENLLPYVLVHHAGRRTAVAVDDLEDESEVLLKPLGFPLNGCPGVMGGTLRPDGLVQIVLDLSNAAPPQMQGSTPKTAIRSTVAGRILVVDDSPTTRTIMRNVFTAAGYAVTTATDGVDALERLRNQLVDLVVSDVEMPRMNGFDLTRQIKATLGLPVILVTGMEKERDRREGLEAGADAYFVKSTFQGEGLLEVVRQLL